MQLNCCICNKEVELDQNDFIVENNKIICFKCTARIAKVFMKRWFSTKVENQELEKEASDAKKIKGRTCC